MSPPLVTALYAGLAALILVALSVRVIAGRYKARALSGDGGDQGLARRIRAQGNFTEYVPIALIVMALLEMANTSVFLVHALGAALILGRLAHAWSMSTCNSVARATGMFLTFAVLIVGGLLSIMAYAGNG